MHNELQGRFLVRPTAIFHTGLAGNCFGVTFGQAASEHRALGDLPDSRLHREVTDEANESRFQVDCSECGGGLSEVLCVGGLPRVPGQAGPKAHDIFENVPLSIHLPGAFGLHVSSMHGAARRPQVPGTNARRQVKSMIDSPV